MRSRRMADGDGRYLLNLAETVWAADTADEVDTAALSSLVQRRAPLYDKGQESHYNLISALHKSLRGSDCDAGLYWLARMLSGGEDPHYIARRLTRFAVEDVGLADPNALTQAIAAWQAFERIGSPRGRTGSRPARHLSRVGAEVERGLQGSRRSHAERPQDRFARPARSIFSTRRPRLMKDLGYGAGYAYDHDAEDSFSGQNYFPDGMPREAYYRPVERGFERDIRKRARLLGASCVSAGHVPTTRRPTTRKNEDPACSPGRRFGAGPLGRVAAGSRHVKLNNDACNPAHHCGNRRRPAARPLVQAEIPGAGSRPAGETPAHRPGTGRW